MAQTKEQITSDNNGFAFPLQPSTDLGLAMLIVESEDGQNEPVAVVGTISEARDVAHRIFATGCGDWNRARTRPFAHYCTKSGLVGPTAATGSCARLQTC
jgi:hypothetical protein